MDTHPSPARSTTSEATTTQEDSIFPTPSTSPWSSPMAFINSSPSPWNSLMMADLLHRPPVLFPSSSSSSTTTTPYRCLSSVAKQHGKILSLALVYHSDSSDELVYAGTDSKSVRIWKLPSFTEFSKLRSGSSNVEALLVNTPHGLVFTAHSDRRIRVWCSNPVHTRKGTLPPPKPTIFSKWTMSTAINSMNKIKHSNAITSLAYNPMLSLLYSGSSDHTIKVWTIAREMRCVETIYAHDDGVNVIVVDPQLDGLVFSGSEDGTVKVWKRSFTGGYYHGLLLCLQQHRSPVKALAVSGGGDCVLYAGCGDGYLHYWKKGRVMGHMSYLGFVRGHGGAILCLATVDKMVVSGSVDRTVRVWRRRSGGGTGGGGGGGGTQHQCTAVLEGHSGPVKGVAVRLDGEHGCMVYSGGLDGCVKQWWVWKEGCSGSGGGGGEEEEEEVVGGGSWKEYFEISSGPLHEK